MAALRIGILVVAALVLAAAAPAQRSVTAGPSAGAAADTVRASVQAGQTLIVGLPGDYEPVRAPALSWLVDRSFMWRTLPRERGTLPVLFRRRGAPADTLVLLVEIRP